MYDYGWRQYMPESGRWGSIDQFAEKFHFASPYTYVLNNPVSFTDPDGRDIIETSTGWTFTGDDINWVMSYLQGGGGVKQLEQALAAWGSSAGGGSTSGSGGGGSGGGGGGSFNIGGSNSAFWNFAGVHLIPEVVINLKGNENTWNKGSNLDFNRYLMNSLFTGALNEWNLQQNRANYYEQVAKTGADKIERNFYLMFGGALVAPFAATYAVAGWTALGSYGTIGAYAQGAIIRGSTDAALQQIIKGSVDLKQTGINALLGGGSGSTAVKLGWANFAGNMANNFGTSIYNGTFNSDLSMNSAKVLTGLFGMGIGNYNGITNGYLGGYLGTTLMPGVYFNTTDVAIEQNKNKK